MCGKWENLGGFIDGLSPLHQISKLCVTQRVCGPLRLHVYDLRGRFETKGVTHLQTNFSVVRPLCVVAESIDAPLCGCPKDVLSVFCRRRAPNTTRRLDAPLALRSPGYWAAFDGLFAVCNATTFSAIERTDMHFFRNFAKHLHK